MSYDLGMAVLIDGDGVNPEHFGRMLAWAARDRPVKIRRIYGSSDKLNTWMECIRNHCITPVINRTNYKNAADIMLAMDAAEMLHSKQVRSFCIVAHDNDFAGLVQWLHEKHAHVEVIWSSTLKEHNFSFQSGCDDSILEDELPYSDDPDPKAQEKLSGWKDAVRQVIKRHACEDGWMLLSEVRNRLKSNGQDIATRDYCHSKLSGLIDSCPEFEIRSERVRLRVQE